MELYKYHLPERLYAFLDLSYPHLASLHLLYHEIPKNRLLGLAHSVQLHERFCEYPVSASCLSTG